MSRKFPDFFRRSARQSDRLSRSAEIGRLCLYAALSCSVALALSRWAPCRTSWPDDFEIQDDFGIQDDFEIQDDLATQDDFKIQNDLAV